MAGRAGAASFRLGSPFSLRLWLRSASLPEPSVLGQETALAFWVDAVSAPCHPAANRL